MNDAIRIRGLAFDLDGTLINSAPGLAEAVDLALQAQSLPAAGKSGSPPGSATVPMCWSSGRCAGRARPTPQRIRATREQFDRYYAQTAERGSALFPQVQETLAQLARQGFPMAVVTNKPTPFCGAFAGIAGH